MEIKVLDSILHGVLKPWKLNTTNKRRYIELVKAAKTASPDNNAALRLQLNALLADYPTLQKVLSNEPQNNGPLQQLLYETELPKYKDPITTFYYFVITIETLRVFNAVLQQAASLTEVIDIRYQIGKTLNNIKVLIKQTIEELREHGFTTVPDEESSFIHFALHYLKHNLIRLYFSLQKSFGSSLKQLTSLEDFYVLDLEVPLSTIQHLEYVGPLESDTKDTAEYNGRQDTICFGFRDSFEKLKMVVNQLCFQIEFLNEDVNTADDLLKVFTSKSILPGAVKIHIGCETKHFRYCIDKFKPYFNDLSLANIEKSKVFYSKNDTLITANNLSSSNSKNKLEPKEKATIDKIFKYLQ